MLVSTHHHPTSLERHGKDGIRRDPPLHFFIDRYDESYKRELDDFVRTLESGARPSIGLDDGRRALAIAEAGVRSAKGGAPVALE